MSPPGGGEEAINPTPAHDNELATVGHRQAVATYPGPHLGVTAVRPDRAGTGDNILRTVDRNRTGIEEAAIADDDTVAGAARQDLPEIRDDARIDQQHVAGRCPAANREIAASGIPDSVGQDGQNIIGRAVADDAGATAGVEFVAEGQAIAAIAGRAERDRTADQEHATRQHVHARTHEDVIGQSEIQAAAQEAETADVGDSGVGADIQNIITAKPEDQLTVLHVPIHIVLHGHNVVGVAEADGQPAAGDRGIRHRHGVVPGAGRAADRDCAVGGCGVGNIVIIADGI